jgi:hypothetical protein
VPIIHVMSQSDYLFGIPVRREDSDAPADRFRHYEMAGAAHATPDELNFSAAPADITRAGVAVPSMTCGEPPAQPLPSHIFFDAMLRNLDLWVRYGIARPTPRRSRWRRAPAWLDQFGNVVGGLRSPYLDVPTSTWFGSTPGAGFCFIAGHEVPLDAATLQRCTRRTARTSAPCQGHRAAGGGALHHRLRRPRADPRGRQRPTSRNPRRPGSAERRLLPPQEGVRPTFDPGTRARSRSGAW